MLPCWSRTDPDPLPLPADPRTWTVTSDGSTRAETSATSHPAPLAAGRLDVSSAPECSPAPISPPSVADTTANATAPTTAPTTRRLVVKCMAEPPHSGGYNHDKRRERYIEQR